MREVEITIEGVNVASGSQTLYPLFGRANWLIRTTPRFRNICAIERSEDSWKSWIGNIPVELDSFMAQARINVKLFGIFLAIHFYSAIKNWSKLLQKNKLLL